MITVPAGVGTVTEIHDYMRLLWARVGVPYSPATGLPIEAQTVSQMVDSVLALPTGTKLLLLALYAVVLLFIAANLTLGITFSSIAQNQLQAMQMTFFFFLPSMLLSGFMFPFRGMPAWAQAIGEVLPLTHFLRIVRGILLKGVEVGQGEASSRGGTGAGVAADRGHERFVPDRG